MALHVCPASLRHLTCGAALLVAGTAHAAGFQLNETSASGLGTAFAGGAAEAADASILWSNVAGMTRIGESQVSGTLHLITPSLKFRNAGSLAATGQGLGGSGGDAGGTVPVPNAYVTKPLDNGLSIGLGITAPWGLVTEYDDGWTGRFQAIKSSIETININPGLAWKASDRVSVGLGLNVQHIKAEFTNQVNYAGALLNAAVLNGVVPGSAQFNALAAAASGLESSATVKGSDTAYGWNAGLMFEVDDRSRIGIGYRSSIKYRVSGTARFANPAVSAPLAALAAGVNAAALYDTRITSDVEIPAVLNLSYFTRLDERWDLMADAQWTQWSTVKNLTFVRANGTVLQNTPENFKNTWKLAIGANYRYNPQWTLRGGIAFDKSPVQRAFLTPRLPDGDRTWLTLGARYTANPKLTVDFGAAYIFVKKTNIDANAGSTAANGLINGHYDSRTVILSAQLNYAF
ncbi:outer membrane protein transport protein [Comamonadaceae bacterium G21597-S1]|nr:outer membrane protein transport protein [Comamonadaceae bacterium G21597-S1]